MANYVPQVKAFKDAYNTAKAADLAPQIAEITEREYYSYEDKEMVKGPGIGKEKADVKEA